MNNLKFNYLSWKFVKRISNLNFSIFVLFVIILFCVLGSLLEQEQEFSYYALNYSKYIAFIWFLGLDHIFRTFWFVFLIFIFLMSLISCTFTTQLPSLKNARRWKFINKNNNLMNSTYSLVNTDYSYIDGLYSLLRLDFFVFCRNSSIYAYKGLYGRIAPIFVHFSIVAILIGSVYGLFCSFVLQEVVPIGEVFHLKNFIYAGFYSDVKKDFFGYIDSFYIDYYNNGSVDQFSSKISIYKSNSKIIYSKLIDVNGPFTYSKITFYQTDWQINAIRIRLGDDYVFQKKLFKKNENNQTFWISSLYLSKKSNLFFIINALNNEIFLCDYKGLILKKVNLGQKFYINSVPYIVENIISSTGLQIKFDPGISIVYMGFFVMIIMTFISYLSYSQVWIYSNLDFIELLGFTNRAIILFNRDMTVMNKIYSIYYNKLIDKKNKTYFLLR
uniref:Cytochrome c biogenesis protein Ccs1 n=1 Tax=Tolypiocladia glomerulata TaxID=860646 RepID=A0A1Z1MU90_9FLOR|nr:cytochrome c biogenesis protein ccs1 [Tolypiocladia glomerulata]ARW69667.1 cytochrome c biogenesis protein ccs1 [Tolypiocladia glomerulata]